MAPDRAVTDDGDDDADWPAAGPGVPPAPSVTPGSAPPPPAYADQPRWTRRGCLLVGAAAGLLLLVVLAGLVALLVVAKGWLDDDDLDEERRKIVETTGIESDSTDVVHPPQRDIKLGACDADDGGVLASGTLTNWSSDDSDYRITVSFREGGAGENGAEFGSTVVTVEGVESETTTSWSASVPTRPTDLFTCRIMRIDRWSSGDLPPGGS